MFLYTNKKVIGVWTFEASCIKRMEKSEVIHKTLQWNIGWDWWDPPRGVPVPLFPWNKLARSPVPQKSKICLLMIPVPQYCLCSPVPLKIWPLFPCSPEIKSQMPISGVQECGVWSGSQLVAYIMFYQNITQQPMHSAASDQGLHCLLT